MLKHIFTFLFISISSLVFAQKYHAIDTYSKSVKFSKNYISAAHKLTDPFQTEEEKARSIFVWLASNIRYDQAQKRRILKKDPVRISASSKEELDQLKKARVNNAIERVVKKKKGVCQDFSWIFQAMLEEIGIECDFVTGYARTNPDLLGRTPKEPSHAWSAAKIDGEWALFDVTWSTDMFENGGDGFFMMPAEEFLKSHFPTEDKWQLIQNPITIKDWSTQIFWYKSYARYQINNLRVNGEEHFILDIPYNSEMTFDLGGSYDLYAIKKNSDKRVKLDKNGSDYSLNFQQNRLRGRTTICILEGKKFIPIMEFKVRS